VELFFKAICIADGFFLLEAEIYFLKVDEWQNAWFHNFASIFFDLNCNDYLAGKIFFCCDYLLSARFFHFLFHFSHSRFPLLFFLPLKGGTKFIILVPLFENRFVYKDWHLNPYGNNFSYASLFKYFFG
jgi:hypothetical protein